jgi:hypothetical protein
VPAAAHRRAVGVDRAERLAGVLHDREAVALERGHVGRVAEDVHGQQRARAPRDRGRRGVRVQVERDGVDVGEHRSRALVENRVGRGDERERRRDDLLALPHADRAQREVQPGRAGRDGARVADPKPRGEGRLECGHARPEGELAGAQDLQHELLLARADHRSRERDDVEVGARHGAGVAAARR